MNKKIHDTASSIPRSERWSQNEKRWQSFLDQRKMAPSTYNLDAEAAVLASVLVDESRYSEIAFLNAEDFFDDLNQRIFRAIRELKIGINVITVAHKMNQAGILKSGELAYLRQIIAELPTSVHAKYYAQIVKESSERRKAISKAGELAKKAYMGRQTKLTEL